MTDGINLVTIRDIDVPFWRIVLILVNGDCLDPGDDHPHAAGKPDLGYSGRDPGGHRRAHAGDATGAPPSPSGQPRPLGDSSPLPTPRPTTA